MDTISMASLHSDHLFYSRKVLLLLSTWAPKLREKIDKQRWCATNGNAAQMVAFPKNVSKIMDRYIQQVASY